MDYSKLIVSNWKKESISIQMGKQCVNFSGSKPIDISNLIFLESEKYGNNVLTY